MRHLMCRGSNSFSRNVSVRKMRLAPEGLPGEVEPSVHITTLVFAGVGKVLPQRWRCGSSLNGILCPSKVMVLVVLS